MQLFILLLVTMNLMPVNDISSTMAVENDIKEENTVVIEVMNPEKIDFQFTMKYEKRRKIIKVRSDKSIKSLRTVDTSTNKHKGYNVRGSDLIILPQSDFEIGTYIAEFKFEDNDAVVLAKIYVAEEALATGE